MQSYKELCYTTCFGKKKCNGLTLFKEYGRIVKTKAQKLT